MLHERWNPEWPQVKAEFKKALALPLSLSVLPAPAGKSVAPLSRSGVGALGLLRAGSRHCLRLGRHRQERPRSAQHAVRGISFVALHGGERVQIGFVFERHPAHVRPPQSWATLWSRACPQCHWRASHGVLCPSPSRAARLPSLTSSSAATEGFSPFAQTRDRPGGISSTWS